MTHSPRGRRLWALLATCCAVLLLAGCDATTGSGPDKAPAKPVGQAVTTPAGSAPTADWKSLAYHAVGCSTRAEWVAEGLPADAWDDATVRTTSADVTGDGTDETLVQLVCPAAVSTRPDRVVVFDVTTARPAPLGVLGDDLFLPQASVTTEGTTVTLSGPTVAGDDPYCCPGHWGSITYAWDGDTFVVASRSEVPGTRPAATTASLSYPDLDTMAHVAIDDVAEPTGTYWVSENLEGAGYTRFRTEGGQITELASIYTP